MELSDVRIGDDGTVKVTFKERRKWNPGRLTVNGVELGECEYTELTYTREEMLFRDST